MHTLQTLLYCSCRTEKERARRGEGERRGREEKERERWKERIREGGEEGQRERQC